MPFTFSHAALVFPINWGFKKWTSMTGLIIGSMVPDFEKFINMRPGNTISHTWEGIFWFSLPVGLLLCFIFHLLVRDPLIDNLPEHIRKRLHVYKGVNWLSHFKKHYLLICISIMIGAFSHIVLDGITKDHERLVRYSPLTGNGIHLSDAIYLSFALIIEVLSGVIGLMLVYYFVLRLPKVSVPGQSIFNKVVFWSVCVLVGGTVVFLRISLDASVDKWELIITTISAFMIGLIGASLWTKMGKRSVSGG
ncbi:DUF4184 family protein [Cognataquiflexum rubidum]|uniref:DUF4184 family protein n=1 Tax=Cognataquiflexum rubidum TaxID=2922273 RepID=UPI001F12A97A|nr:DUF4184 family protein [Cognataquiflexum rubidum]MCH6232853.1 DUF4184 family protein [Cognataquiflexum rubidum]